MMMKAFTRDAGVGVCLVGLAGAHFEKFLAAVINAARYPDE